MIKNFEKIVTKFRECFYNLFTIQKPNDKLVVEERPVHYVIDLDICKKYLKVFTTKTGTEFYYEYSIVFKSKSRKQSKAWKDFENSFLNGWRSKKLKAKLRKRISKDYSKTW